jgi:glycosyltransferase involved in cell wall biosynthesis
VSVVTVVYGGAATLERTMQSVLKQTYEPIEYIVVDGGSKDGTVEIIRRAEDRLDYWVSEPDDGIYDAMNKGIALSTGAIIGLLNSDDWLLDGAIASIVELAAAEPTADIFFGEVALRTQGELAILAGAELPLQARDFCANMPVPHPGMYVRRRCYEKNGVYRTTLPIAADYELVLRNYQAGTKFARIHRPLVSMAPAGNSSQVMAALAEESLILRLNASGWRVRVCHWSVVLRSKVFIYLERTPIGRSLIWLYRRGRSLLRKLWKRR